MRWKGYLIDLDRILQTLMKESLEAFKTSATSASDVSSLTSEMTPDILLLWVVLHLITLHIASTISCNLGDQ